MTDLWANRNAPMVLQLGTQRDLSWLWQSADAGRRGLLSVALVWSDTHHPDSCLGAIANTESLEDTATVGLHGFVADAERTTDLLVRVACGDEQKNLLLARCKRVVDGAWAATGLKEVGGD